MREERDTVIDLFVREASAEGLRGQLLQQRQSGSDGTVTRLYAFSKDSQVAARFPEWAQVAAAANTGRRGLWTDSKGP